MKLGFLEDSKILKTNGDWHLAIYNNRCLALVHQSGNEIKTLGSVCEDKEDGTIADEFELLDWLSDEYMRLHKQNA